MTEEQFGTFLGIIKAAYPKDKLFALDGDTMKDVWYRLLSDLDGNVVKAAAIKWVSTEKWPRRLQTLGAFALTSRKALIPMHGARLGSR